MIQQNKKTTIQPLSPLNADKCDIDIKDAEIAHNYNCDINIDGSLGNFVRVNYDKSNLTGIELLTYHDQRAILYQSQDDGHINLYSASRTDQSQSFTITQYIGTAPRIQSFKICANRIFLLSGEGLFCLLWTEGAYRLLNPAPSPMSIDFGLQKAGHLVYDQIKRDNPYLSFQQAIRAQVASKGYFYQPFLLRYAYRMCDGSTIMPSAPMLMLPTVLSPIIIVDTVESQDGAEIIDIDLSQNNYFELRYRPLNDAERCWDGIIEAVEIYISMPIWTYDTATANDGYLSTLETQIQAMDTADYPRGRRYQTLTDNQYVFQGHYSEANDSYIDHTLDPDITHSEIWAVQPNTHIQDDIITTSKFYKIADIPYSQLRSETQFLPVPITTSDDQALKNHQELNVANPLPHTIIPTALTTMERQIIVGSQSISLATPTPFRGLCAFSGDADNHDCTDMVMTIYLKWQGQTYRKTMTTQGMPNSITEYLPRYLFYPDSRAFMLTISQGQDTCTFLLTPHPNMEGAYWWGGLNADVQTDASLGESSPIIDDVMPTEATVYTGKTESYSLLTPNLVLGDGKIVGLESALEPPRSGTFGKYPIYIFTEDGVWLAQFDDLSKSFASVRKVIDDRCVSHRAIVRTERGIAYATPTDIRIINGSEHEVISFPLQKLNFDFSSLPYADALMEKHALCQVETQTKELLSTCVLCYSREYDVLMVLSTLGYALLYWMKSQAWSVVDIPILSESGLSNPKLLKLEESSARKRGLIITRPIVVSSFCTAGSIRLEAEGVFRRGHVTMALYGANQSKDWHLIASSRTHVLENFNLRAYRFLRVALFTDLDTDEYIYSLKWELRDDSKSI